MSNLVLLVDDEENILSSYRRTLRKDFNLMTALGGELALEIIKSKGPFAVVVTDMQMPGMNGIEFLSRVKEISPDTIRMMLTGHADFNTAMEAVNEGNIFRFITKPCSPENLIHIINDGIRQYELIKGEQELLNKTLQGSIKILIEILSMIDQEMFSRALQLRDFIRKISERRIISANWELEIAALLAQIGIVTVPSVVIEKVRNNQNLSEVEKSMLERVPSIGHDLLKNIPRLTAVAKIIKYQSKRFNGEGPPLDSVKGTQIPTGSRIFKIYHDFCDLLETGHSRSEARAILNERIGWYDPTLLNVILSDEVLDDKEAARELRTVKQIKIEDIRTGHILADGLETNTGQLLVMSGQEITEALLIRIRNWARLYKIKEPIYVIV